ncbi:hypothetical protein [Agromyces marinus]|uniref:Uncharacterized protein n=1 Tax=Agromyces marinus TaxID=1389020 RepID=A0ABM8H127_9MICO|nr:hypothetical protein [Agromyces marinus]UIP57434.1 hypothetical protein DSM26151_02910 [Agromyces marinus]BDZ54442.1 hypothetical protein GCM10025870_15150 [Agromyces marinus]
MRRITMPAALVFAGALALTGCASGGDSTASGEESCATAAAEVRDISNGVQNNIAAPSSLAGLQEYLAEASERTDALIEDAGDDDALIDALGGFQTALNEVSTYADGLEEVPSEEDPSAMTIEQDPDQLAAQQAAVQEASAEVSASCESDPDSE